MFMLESDYTTHLPLVDKISVYKFKCYRSCCMGDIILSYLYIF